MSSVIDGKPEQILRLPGSSFVPLCAAIATGGFFVLGTYHLWLLASVSLVLATAIVVYWLWTGTAQIPEKPMKDAGLGLSLPLYRSGPVSVSWWAMFITMLAVLTAFISLVFSYFFFWTVHGAFPPEPFPGPDPFWPALGGGLVLGAWALTMVARRRNRADDARGFYLAMAAGSLLAVVGGAALIAGPLLADLDPTAHVYQATVWLLLIWSAGHLALGLLMNGYCLARRMAGRMTATHDIDIANVALYWHFCTVTSTITVLVVAGFPLAA